jgi:WhiB family transcriptional regulator, redox-sensing transcriptional regulator
MMDWMQHAACADADPDTWFVPELAEVAKELCSGCPVRDDCLEFALANVDDDRATGVWGGCDGPERSQLRSKRRCGPPHGSLSRYLGKCRCDPCVEAGRAYYQDRRNPVVAA